MSFKARGVLALIFSNVDTWEVHQSWVQEQGTEGREAISGAMQEMEKYGYATYEEDPRNESGQFTGSTWTFYDTPIPEPHRTNRTKWRVGPCYGKPYDGLPHDGSPCHGNPATKNTIQKENHNQNTITRDELFKDGVLFGMTKREESKLPSRFDEFWKLYPRKDAKDKARQAWTKKKCDAMADKIITALKAHLTRKDWLKDNGEFIPYPASWINAGRWDDEIKPQKSRTDTSEGHAF